MQKESISRKTFVKGICAGVIAACSLGVLHYAEYSTVKGAGDYDFVPGTYQAQADGMDGPVTVTITVDDKSITKVTVDVSGETAGIGAEIGDEVTQQIMDAQSSAIDGVAGATVSSTAVKAALDAAIANAESGTDPVDESAMTEAAAEAETSAPETEAATEAAETEAPMVDTSNASYTPGTYKASAKGISSDVTAEVTVDDHSITDVKLDVSGETPEIGGKTGDLLASAILDKQSADIDNVTGATITSTAAKTAVNDALKQAMGEAVPAEAADMSETEMAETEAAAPETEMAETEAAVPETEMAKAEMTEAAMTEEETMTAETEAAGGKYVPGTYKAVGKGMDGDVPVEITVDDHSITDVKVDVSGETKGIGAEIGDEVTKQIMDAQSADIDGVSGATVTSTAVKDAVADALAQAAGGEEAVSEAATEVLDAGDASEVTYKAGTYKAAGKGMDGDVPVEITVDDHSITGVKVDVSGETKGIGAEIGDEVTKQIMDAQSADIDGVSGATVTSTAVKDAVKDALEQAVKAAK